MRVIGENKTKPNPHPISMQPLRPMWDNHSSRLSNVHGFDVFLRIHKCLEIVPDLRTFVVSTFCFLSRSLHCCPPPQITTVLTFNYPQVIALSQLSILLSYMVPERCLTEPILWLTQCIIIYFYSSSLPFTHSIMPKLILFFFFSLYLQF